LTDYYDMRDEMQDILARRGYLYPNEQARVKSINNLIVKFEEKPKLKNDIKN